MTQNRPVQVFEGGWELLQHAIFTDNQISLGLTGTLFSFDIKQDGTELYVLEIISPGNSFVRTFSITTPAWDPDSVVVTPLRSFPITTDDDTPTSINFQKGEFAGTQMFIVGQGSKVMLAYTVPDAFDTDSIVASPASISLSDVGGTVSGGAFSRDGDFFFVTELIGGNVYSFPMPTNWDITSNTSNTSKATGLITLFGLEVKPEGDKMYIMETNGDDTLHEFDMTTPNDISTLSSSVNQLNFVPAAVSDIVFRPNGKEFFNIQDCNLFTRFHVDQQWDLSTASLFTNALPTVDFQKIFWKADGTKFFCINSSVSDRIDEFTTINRWNVTGSTITGNFSLGGIAAGPRGLWVSHDGETCMITDNGTNSIIRLDMSTGWDIDTMSNPSVAFDLGAEVPGLTNPTGVSFRNDLLTYYITDSASDDVVQFTVPTPLDIANSVFTGNSLNLSGEGDLTDIQIKPDETLMFVCTREIDRVRLFSLPPDGNVSNALPLQDLNVEALEDTLQGFDIRQFDGKQLSLVGLASGNITTMDMTSEFNNSIASNSGADISTQEGEAIVYV